ncbi:hypothetical protein J7337_013781 [Fusarium musae]|uniref:MACPF domain-containing protein n=1 Tax=Fusarium musae TaxID=1042133 RepID=A0A9P8IIH5_9HYPO|nr:hypothetical protein J7337_013781 [Fusarium musae]KAG9495532.1 hypothetical protein J7337_013781 [Fusarium musae]
MTLETDFPQNPTQPSLRYAVSTQMPLALPWTNAYIQVGKCLLESQGSQFRFGEEEMAFGMDSLLATPLIYTETRTGVVNQATVSGSSNSHRDLSADIAGSIGGSVMGGSARGQYSKNSNQDESHNKASVHTSFRCGKVTLAHFPSLSEDATRILRTSDDPCAAFRDKFGDYFVGGYILGGTNSTVMWGTGASQGESERLDISFEVHLLFLSYEDSIKKNDDNYSSAGAANLAAFDSLDAYQAKVEASNYGSYRTAVETSIANRQRGAELQGRVLAKLKSLDLGPSGSQLPWEKCDELCRSGLVLELLMLPWAGLRDYRDAICAPRE